MIMSMLYIYRCTDVRPYSTYHLISFHCCFYSQASETLRNPFEVSCVFNCTQEDGRVRRKITMTKGFWGAVSSDFHHILGKHEGFFLSPTVLWGLKWNVMGQDGIYNQLYGMWMLVNTYPLVDVGTSGQQKAADVSQNWDARKLLVRLGFPVI